MNTHCSQLKVDKNSQTELLQCFAANMDFVPGLTFALVCYFDSKTNIVLVDRAKSFVDSSQWIPFVSRSKYANVVCIHVHLAACFPFYFCFYQILEFRIFESVSLQR